jgi:hypothetical protein
LVWTVRRQQLHSLCDLGRKQRRRLDEIPNIFVATLEKHTNELASMLVFKGEDHAEEHIAKERV